jgi:2-iminobutanoate/2-iminopropanoate deaminase
MMPVRKNYASRGEVTAPYVHAVSHNQPLYVSGLTAFGTPANQGISRRRLK